MGLKAALVALTLLGAGGGASQQQQQQVVVLTAHHSRFEPAAVAVRPGTTVRFVVRNLDPIDHELIVGDAAVQARHETGTEPHHGAVPGEVSVPALATAETTYRVPAEGGGELFFGCHLPGHWAYGMRGELATRR